ncbi:hypothetical protein CLOP_g2961, partial [Closterium sp. NIES-67]
LARASPPTVPSPFILPGDPPHLESSPPPPLGPVRTNPPKRVHAHVSRDAPPRITECRPPWPGPVPHRTS